MCGIFWRCRHVKPRVWICQFHRLGPPPSWLEWSQISNFLDGLGTLVSKWPEKAKNLFTELYLDSDYQNNFQKWPFSLMSPGIFDIVLMILKLCESLQTKFRLFRSFRHRVTQVIQEIWNLAENEAVRGWFHVLIQPKWGCGSLMKFKQVTPTSLAQTV